ncbi:hypothetical protein PR003_g20929 [Phytophthora rubi]|uniref:WLGC domain-containing protein n=1 Tax=Phytophthora rubi TaxID=129364 RepID=A0A6A4DKG7_9STRA|nr:hypothetical protein PR002_g18332 [Phytophthora rubi]KAE9307725.1 hypothetical protein PR003_g20929 [Phytophthora rubi]
MLVVVYCLSAFTFDRTKFAINMEVYPSGWFEQTASVNADPVQVAVIYKSLKSLRIMSVLECLSRVGVNVMFSFRLHDIVQLSRRPRRLRSSVYPKRHRLGALGLVLYALLVVIFVEESMRTSAQACQPHPECVVNAHRWTILQSSSLTQCPCLMLIDGDIAPKTFDEWIMPKNVTDKVANFLALQEFPLLTNLHNLERLVIVGLPSIDSLPDLAPVQSLKSFVVSDRGTWCCNGFLGDCDLSSDKCMVHPVWGTPAATCLPSNRTEKIATPATLELVQKFAPTVCGPVLRPGELEGPPTPDIMAPCNGTLYRQCPTPDNTESMCYNARFMAIACTTNPFPIEMRRRQIAQGVGDKCDPEAEAWLGCT